MIKQMSGLKFSDKLRIELAVRWVDFLLDARVPRARRRQIRDELRSNLIEAAQRVGSEAAVRQLGDLNALAKSYLEVYRGRWDFRAGCKAVIAVYATIQVLSLAIFLAFSSGVLASGGHGASYTFWPGFGVFSGSASAHEFTVSILSPADLALMALAFVIGSSYRTFFRRYRPRG